MGPAKNLFEEGLRKGVEGRVLMGEKLGPFDGNRLKYCSSKPLEDLGVRGSLSSSEFDSPRKSRSVDGLFLV